MRPVVAVLGTFDTKEADFSFVIEKIREAGCETLAIDAGSGKSSCPLIDITNEQLVSACGHSLDELENTDRAAAISILSEGARLIVKKLYDEEKIDAIMSMGGSGGTTLASSVMGGLPVGFPKLLVSTLAGTPSVNRFNADNDIIVINSVVDVAGLNSISKIIYSQAAGAIAGAVKSLVKDDSKERRLRIAMTMYGLTSKGVTTAKEYLEEKGYEVLVFHATGAGGNAMEKLIRSGFFDGVLDMTLTELNDYTLVGEKSCCKVIPGRLEGAAEMNIPCVVCPGAMDMCETEGAAPEETEGRIIYCHNDRPTHFRINNEDALRSGKCVGEKLAKNKAETAIFFPHGGLSGVDEPGKQLYNPETDSLLFDAIRKYASNGNTEFFDYELSINDAEFALKIAAKMDEYMKKHYK